jgi:cell division protein FtsB
MKFCLVNFVKISLFALIFFYLTARLTFGEKGMIAFYRLEERFKSNLKTLEFVKNESIKLDKKFQLLNEKSVNSIYLDELARTTLEYGKEDEGIIILENDN